jgi:pSer/pThr/pTyr-binding forkhead associated (FHA) protein
MRIWIVGSGGNCDIVVAQPRVSRRHCRFTELADGYLLEDLGSSNGTYVNGERIDAATRVTAGDRITMGALEPMPWPPASGIAGATVLRIGRAADNDIVLDDARVSSHHARLIVSPARTLIEDAGSSNGTFLNSPDRRVMEPTLLAGTDTVFFGSLAITATRLLPAPPAPARTVAHEPVLAPPPILGPSEPPGPATVPPSPATAMVGPWTMLILAQAPIIALLIYMAFGGQATAASWPTAAEGIASTMFALALSAVWLGGSLAAWASLAGRSSAGRRDFVQATLLGPQGLRIAALGAECVVQCALLLAIVYLGSDLRGPWLPMFGVLLLTSAVGLALGLLVFRLIRAPILAVAVLLLAFFAMLAMGGRIWPISALRPAAPLAAAMPTRWAFEGLLLLENERRPPSDTAERPESDRAEDLAEGYFRADSERMGPKADAMALGFMLIGLAAASAFISADRK